MFAHFNHSQLRRYIIAFGSVFNGIVVSRTEADGDEVQRLAVPIQYGPKERWLTRLLADPDLTRSTSIILPRITFELDTVQYDSGRAINPNHRLTFDANEVGKNERLYVGVPYNLNFNLNIMVKFQRDGLQIVEQILPYFTPDLTLAIAPVNGLGIVDQVPLTLTSVGHSDSYEGDFEKRRAIIWTLTYTMKVNLYGPRRTGSRIEQIMVDVHNSPFTLDDPETDADLVSTITTTADPTEQDPTNAGYPTANTVITRYE